jgi:hypothetical protein
MCVTAVWSGNALSYGKNIFENQPDRRNSSVCHDFDVNVEETKTNIKVITFERFLEKNDVSLKFSFEK